MRSTRPWTFNRAAGLGGTWRVVRLADGEVLGYVCRRPGGAAPWEARVTTPDRAAPEVGAGWRTRDAAAAELLRRRNAGHPHPVEEGQAPGRIGPRGPVGQTVIAGTRPEAPAPDTDPEGRGRRLRRERQAAGLTLRAFSALVGVELSKLSRLERGLVDDAAAWVRVEMFGLTVNAAAAAALHGAGVRSVDDAAVYVIERGPHDPERSAWVTLRPEEVANRGGRLVEVEGLARARARVMAEIEELREPLTVRRNTQYLYAHDGASAVFFYRKKEAET